MHNKEGFTLIELIFALFIISVAVLAVVSGFLGINSLVEETKKIIAADKYIAGQMENIRGTAYDDIESPETPVEIQLIDPSDPSSPLTTSVNVKLVNVSSSWTSSFFKQTTRTIRFYIYKKGINYRDHEKT